MFDALTDRFQKASETRRIVGRTRMVRRKWKPKRLPALHYGSLDNQN